MQDPTITRSQVMKSLATVFGFDVGDAEAVLFIDEMEKRGLRIVDVYESGGHLPTPKPRLSNMRASLAVSPDATPEGGGEEKL